MSDPSAIYEGNFGHSHAAAVNAVYQAGVADGMAMALGSQTSLTALEDEVAALITEAVVITPKKNDIPAEVPAGV